MIVGDLLIGVLLVWLSGRIYYSMMENFFFFFYADNAMVTSFLFAPLLLFAGLRLLASGFLSNNEKHLRLARISISLFGVILAFYPAFVITLCADKNSSYTSGISLGIFVGIFPFLYLVYDLLRKPILFKVKQHIFCLVSSFVISTGIVGVMASITKGPLTT
jgi:hypothetical protein